MRKYTAILTFLFLFLFVGSVSAGYVGTIETWTNTLTVQERTWSTLDTWTNTLTVSDTPTPAWGELDTWTNTLTVQVAVTDPEDTYANYYYFEEGEIHEIRGRDEIYANARITYYLSNSDTYGMLIGQYLSIDGLTVHRGYLILDLTAHTREFTEASIYSTAYTDESTDDFDIDLVGYTESDVSADSTSFNGFDTDIFATWNSVNYNTNNHGIRFELNGDGIDYLNDHLGEMCIFVLMSDNDLDAVAPTDYERVWFYSPDTSIDSRKPVLYYNDTGTAWSTLDTWDNTLTVTSAGSWSELDTWDNTLTVGEETPTPVEPLVDYDTLITKILMPFILLFLIAFVLGQEFGAVGFIVGAMIGLFLVWMITGISFGLVLLGLFVLAAIWWRM